MNRPVDFFVLTVSHWDRAVEAGVKPVIFTSFTDDDNPAYYRPHEIYFQYPPTREDFLEVVQRTPWMRVWEADLLPLTAKNDWPLVPHGHKSQQIDLESDGKVLGSLRVHRLDCNQNKEVRYKMPFITVEEEEQALFGVREEVESEARALLMKKSSAVREKLLKMPDWQSKDVVFALKQILFEGGFRKTKPRETAKC